MKKKMIRFGVALGTFAASGIAAAGVYIPTCYYVWVLTPFGYQYQYVCY